MARMGTDVTTCGYENGGREFQGTTEEKLLTSFGGNWIQIIKDQKLKLLLRISGPRRLGYQCLGEGMILGRETMEAGQDLYPTNISASIASQATPGSRQEFHLLSLILECFSSII